MHCTVFLFDLRVWLHAVERVFSTIESITVRPCGRCLCIFLPCYHHQPRLELWTLERTKCLYMQEPYKTIFTADLRRVKMCGNFVNLLICHFDNVFTRSQWSNFLNPFRCARTETSIVGRDTHVQPHLVRNLRTLEVVAAQNTRFVIMALLSKIV